MQANVCLFELVCHEMWLANKKLQYRHGELFQHKKFDICLIRSNGTADFGTVFEMNVWNKDKSWIHRRKTLQIKLMRDFIQVTMYFSHFYCSCKFMLHFIFLFHTESTKKNGHSNKSEHKYTFLFKWKNERLAHLFDWH